MGTLMLLVLAWFLLGFLVQLLKFPREETVLSSRKKKKAFFTKCDFWVAWCYSGLIGVCVYILYFNRFEMFSLWYR